MRLLLHRKVYSDIFSIMEYYEQVGTTELADEVFRELRHLFQKAAERPEGLCNS